MKSIVILISGRGSNMEAIVNASIPVEIRAVIANRPDAKGLSFAASRGIATEVIDHKAFASRDEFDAALAQAIARHQPDFIVLAGFMRVLTTAFLAQHANRVVNIHPSLLPAFPGLHTHRQALAAGVKIHGATVHFVTPQLDLGPIIAQAAVPVMSNDAEASLAARVLAQEHRIYPLALKWLAEGRLEILPGGVVRLKGSDVSGGDNSDHLCNPFE
jgi:phosphoribosylglycinamide formyltransferase-1